MFLTACAPSSRPAPGPDPSTPDGGHGVCCAAVSEPSGCVNTRGWAASADECAARTVCGCVEPFEEELDDHGCTVVTLRPSTCTPHPVIDGGFWAVDTGAICSGYGSTATPAEHGGYCCPIVASPSACECSQPIGGWVAAPCDCDTGHGSPCDAAADDWHRTTDAHGCALYTFTVGAPGCLWAPDAGAE